MWPHGPWVALISRLSPPCSSKRRAAARAHTLSACACCVGRAALQRALIVAGAVVRNACNVGRDDLADVFVVVLVELRGLDVAAAVLLKIQIVYLADSNLNGRDVFVVPGCR